MAHLLDLIFQSCLCVLFFPSQFSVPFVNLKIKKERNFFQGSELKSYSTVLETKGCRIKGRKLNME